MPAVSSCKRCREYVKLKRPQQIRPNPFWTYRDRNQEREVIDVYCVWVVLRNYITSALLCCCAQCSLQRHWNDPLVTRFHNLHTTRDKNEYNNKNPGNETQLPWNQIADSTLGFVDPNSWWLFNHGLYAFHTLFRQFNPVNLTNKKNMSQLSQLRKAVLFEQNLCATLANRWTGGSGVLTTTKKTTTTSRAWLRLPRGLKRHFFPLPPCQGGPEHHRCHHHHRGNLVYLWWRRSNQPTETNRHQQDWR